MKKNRAIAGVALGLFLATPSAFATVISSFSDLGSGSWRGDYEVTNDSLTVPFDEFTIYFDYGSFGNLRDASGPVGWDLLAIDPDPLLPDDGFFDALALGAPLSPGASLGLFSITFDFLGSGAPGTQRFEFIDSASFTVLESGVTRLASTPPTAVAEPGTLLLGALGLLTLGLATRLRSRGLRA